MKDIIFEPVDYSVEQSAKIAEEYFVSEEEAFYQELYG